MKMLGDMQFLATLKEYDKDNIPIELVTKIKNNYLSNPDFNPLLIKNVSSACQGLCKWVIAVCRYNEIFKVSILTKIFGINSVIDSFFFILI
jgi:dynein heavy chain